VSEQQPERQPTGDEQVDQALALLHDLDDRPVDEHVERFEQVHASLRGALNRPADQPSVPAVAAPTS
jgi:hypothetical protein